MTPAGAALLLRCLEAGQLAGLPAAHRIVCLAATRCSSSMASAECRSGPTPNVALSLASRPHLPGSTRPRLSSCACLLPAQDRLVEYDRESAKRTTVYDDQADFFEIDANAWLTGGGRGAGGGGARCWARRGRLCVEAAAPASCRASSGEPRRSASTACLLPGLGACPPTSASCHLAPLPCCAPASEARLAPLLHRCRGGARRAAAAGAGDGRG